MNAVRKEGQKFVRVRQKGRAKVCKSAAERKEGRAKVCKSVAIKKCGKKGRNNC